MYEVLRDYTHPITGNKMRAGEIVSINCAMSVRMLTKEGVIKKVGKAN